MGGFGSFPAQQQSPQMGAFHMGAPRPQMGPQMGGAMGLPNSYTQQPQQQQQQRAPQFNPPSSINSTNPFA